MSVARCQAEVSSAEFADWLAYHQIEPFGEQMADLRAGAITAAIYNVNRDTKRRPEPFGPSDVIPWIDGLSTRLEPEPVLLDDPVAQTAMLRASIFGKRANG
ncbi:hypothetical protein EN871_16825 [bacterium M00.F.Ca.ET.228.01.1.1]|nr:hypothetical protein EN871_16825 [bacterium M00.F.Ca.ET.228.01.1.1]TGS00911.1 hypothetical protein EN834_16820 [bacterium M00.F.Ca.ET.191.01.1.1]TGU05296.1 hypothetical protein EN798_17640 [bacterium M00.F.Ca.ET.155.01.1.1]